MRAFSERTGIAGSVDKLRQVPGTTAELEAEISDRLRKSIERLVGKAWDKIGKSDLAKVQGWAQRTRRRSR